MHHSMTDAGLFDETALDKAMRFQNGLIARATGGTFDGDDEVCKELRLFFGSRPDTKAKLPDLIRRGAAISRSSGASSSTSEPIMPSVAC